jgi:hypothetical protein
MYTIFFIQRAARHEGDMSVCVLKLQMSVYKSQEKVLFYYYDLALA